MGIGTTSLPIILAALLGVLTFIGAVIAIIAAGGEWLVGRARSSQGLAGRHGDPASMAVSAPDYWRLSGGERVSLLLVFLRDEPACEEVLAEVATVAGRASHNLIFVHAIYAGPAPDSVWGPARQGFYVRRGIQVWQNEPDLFERYQVPAVPFVVYVSKHGETVLGERVRTKAAARRLLHRILPSGTSVS